MKAMVFAAGIGSRLKELTRDRPKPLMEVGGKTMIEHVFDRLIAAGVTEAVINLHYLPDTIVDYLAVRNNLGIRISYSREASLLDTGGGLKRARSFFEGSTEPFFVHNADIFCDWNLAALRDEHEKSGNLATLGVMHRASKRGLYFDSSMQLTGWTQESDSSPSNGSLFSFSGIQIVSPKIFSFMPDREVFSIIEPYLSAARSGQRVRGLDMKNVYWMDIGTPEHLAELRERLK